MSQNLLMAIPMVGLSGIRGVLVGAGAIVGFGIGKSFGRMACEKMDYLEDGLAASVHPGFERLSDRISSFSERWR
jgi:hypothetical protein|tara:strand:+ start:571 stop:795 length:225 start_codon:yes stop_codon:yes gene_type:complete